MVNAKTTIIPKDWKIEKLEKLGNPIIGLTYNPRDIKPEGLLVLRSSNVFEGKLKFENNVYVNTSIPDKLRVQKGDLLICVRNGSLRLIGKCALIDENYPDVTFGAFMSIFRSSFNDFIFQQFQSEKIKRQITENLGATINQITNKVLNSFEILFPEDPNERKSISKILSDMDQIIQQLDYLIIKKKNIKQGTIQELLTGKRRLEGFIGKWKIKKLGDLGEPIIGLTYDPRDIASEGILVLRSSNVFEGQLRFDDNVYVDMDIPNRLRVQKGDILICVRNGSRRLIGKCAHIEENYPDVTFGAFMSIFRSSFNDFIFQQFQSEKIKRQITENLGATINQITNKVLNSFEISFPEDPDERKAIAQVLSDMDLEIQELENKRDKYIMIKNGMMQKLLTGEIRLV